MRARAGWVGCSVLAAFAAIQVVPVERGNPPVESDVAAPPEVATVLRRACYDCHSNETKWPWYSRLAQDMMGEPAVFYRAVGRFLKAFLDVETTSFEMT